MFYSRKTFMIKHKFRVIIEGLRLHTWDITQWWKCYYELFIYLYSHFHSKKDLIRNKYIKKRRLKSIGQKSSFPLSSYFELCYCYSKCAMYTWERKKNGDSHLFAFIPENLKIRFPCNIRQSHSLSSLFSVICSSLLH
jgi:hypothetical protein